MPEATKSNEKPAQPRSAPERNQTGTFGAAQDSMDSAGEHLNVMPGNFKAYGVKL
jgi:hypothetical protein